MQVGILGGTFDPIHFGHLRFAEEGRELFGLEEIIFIPCGMPPHKEANKITPAEKRLKMVELAVAGNPHFCVWDIEVKRPWLSYSVETIREIRARYSPGMELFFLVGGDAFKEIGTWKDYEELLSLCHFVVATRAGQKGRLPLEVEPLFCYDKEERVYRHKKGGTRLYLAEITALDISSTKIREAVQEGRSIKYVVPREVEDYIIRERLYTERNG